MSQPKCCCDLQLFGCIHLLVKCRGWNTVPLSKKKVGLGPSPELHNPSQTTRVAAAVVEQGRMVVEEVEENTSIRGSESLSVLLLDSESSYRQWMEGIDDWPLGDVYIETLLSQKY